MARTKGARDKKPRKYAARTLPNANQLLKITHYGRLITIAEAAEQRQCSVDTLRKWLREVRLLNPKRKFITLSEVLAPEKVKQRRGRHA